MKSRAEWAALLREWASRALEEEVAHRVAAMVDSGDTDGMSPAELRRVALEDIVERGAEYDTGGGVFSNNDERLEWRRIWTAAKAEIGRAKS